MKSTLDQAQETTTMRKYNIIAIPWDVRCSPGDIALVLKGRIDTLEQKVVHHLWATKLDTTAEVIDETFVPDVHDSDFDVSFEAKIDEVVSDRLYTAVDNVVESYLRSRGDHDVIEVNDDWLFVTAYPDTEPMSTIYEDVDLLSAAGITWEPIQ